MEYGVVGVDVNTFDLLFAVVCAADAADAALEAVLLALLAVLESVVQLLEEVTVLMIELSVIFVSAFDMRVCKAEIELSVLDVYAL